MRKFYENPSMTVKKFGKENVVTESGTLKSADINDDGITALKGQYAVREVSAASLTLTF